MKNLALYIVLSIITVSCSSTIKKSREVKNQPIIDYIESIVAKDSVILIHEDKISTSFLIETIRTGKLSGSKQKKDGINFNESIYYKEDAWKTLDKKYSNDTIVRNWNDKDFTFPNEIMTKEYLKAQRYNVKSYETRRSLFIFSDVLYYDKNQYAIFYLKIAGNIVLSGYIENAILILKKKNGKWVLIDKVYEYPTIYY